MNIKLKWIKLNEWCYQFNNYTITLANGVKLPYSLWYLKGGKFENAICLGHFKEKGEAIECLKSHNLQMANNAQ